MHAAGCSSPVALARPLSAPACQPVGPRPRTASTTSARSTGSRLAARAHWSPARSSSCGGTRGRPSAHPGSRPAVPRAAATAGRQGVARCAARCAALHVRGCMCCARATRDRTGVLVGSLRAARAGGRAATVSAVRRRRHHCTLCEALALVAAPARCWCQTRRFVAPRRASGDADPLLGGGRGRRRRPLQPIGRSAATVAAASTQPADLVVCILPSTEKTSLCLL